MGDGIGSAEATVAELGEGRPRLPDGRIDFRGASTVPVVTVFVRHRGRVLVLRRSGQVGSYRGRWAGVAGHLDRVEPVERKAFEELCEEIGLAPEAVTRLVVGEPFAVEDGARTWLVFPALADVAAAPTPALEHEHTEWRWVEPTELANLDTVPQLDRSLRHALAAAAPN